ncbi:MAG: hypothetical protein ACI976_002844, partial [Aureispira sp.]
RFIPFIVAPFYKKRINKAEKIKTASISKQLKYLNSTSIAFPFR